MFLIFLSEKTCENPILFIHIFHFLITGYDFMVGLLFIQIELFN
jgi:hypothetical protein